MYIDTHAHLYLQQYDEDIDDTIGQALQAQVTKIFLPNIDSSTISALNGLSDSYEMCYPMMGLHPCSVKENYQEELALAASWLDKRKYYGIGETGIDLHWDTTFKKEQIEAFETQISWAIDRELPIIIHSRKSLDLTIDIIASNKHDKLTGIFHCFNGSIDQCKRVLDCNFFMGLGGVITYKNAGLEDMIGYMPMSHMVLETDAPYLSPVPYRGKRNQSSYIPYIAEKISQVKGMDIADIRQDTTNNALNLFKIDD